MAYPIQQSVIDFHKKFGHPVRDIPQALEEGEALQAFAFIEEECSELYDAVYEPIKCGCADDDCSLPATGPYDPKLVEIADALGDIVVTAYGMAIRHGIDLDRVLAAIMESNMTKEPNGMGKIKKGADYQPPKIAEALGL